MPNWVRGNYAIKGTKENVLKFLNEGLKNSGCELMTDCQQAFDCLKQNAKTKQSEFFYLDEKKRAGNTAGTPAEIVYVNKLTLDTFRPMPDTFRMYDTTNFADDMPEIAAEQKRLYGCVGWYDWGLMYRGTKWNTELNDFKLEIKSDIATVTFGCSTAWSYPDAWLHWVKDTFDVAVLLCVSEESNMFNFYGEIDEDESAFDIEEKEGKPNEDDYEDEDDFWEALWMWQDECISNMFDEFSAYVENYEAA